MRTLACLPDRLMAEPWEWVGHAGDRLQVRDALYRALEAEQSARARATAPSAEAGHILGLAQQAFGDLRAACWPAKKMRRGCQYPAPSP
jgi:hypothetical protein